MHYSHPPVRNSSTTRSSTDHSSIRSFNQSRILGFQNYIGQQPLVSYSDQGFLIRSPTSDQGLLSSLKPLAYTPLMRSHSAPLEYQHRQPTIQEHCEMPIDFNSIEHSMNRIEEFSTTDIIGLDKDFTYGKFGFLKTAVEHGFLTSEGKMYLLKKCEENYLNNSLEPLIIALARARNDGQYSNVLDLLSKGRHAELASLISGALISRENCLILKIYCIKNSNIIQNVWLHAEIIQYFLNSPLV
ncbi:MAG: hypothetical protein V4629_04295 [Pseudomonadota bacterium]